MKIIRYALIALYYAIFFVLQRVLDTTWSRGELVIFLFFGAIPFVLMFVERMSTPDHIIKKSMWYGVLIIVSDFVLKTILNFNMYTGSPFKFLFTVFSIIVGGLIVLPFLVLIVAIFVYIIILLKRLYRRNEPSVIKSVLYTIPVYLIYFLRVRGLFRPFGDFGYLKSEFLFFIPALDLIGPLLCYIVLVFMIIIISYARDNHIMIQKVFYQALVLYFSYFVIYATLVIYKVFGAILLLIPGSETTPVFIDVFSYFFTIVGIWFTIFVFFISRKNDDKSKEVIFSYKAIVVVTFILLAIFI